MTNKKLHDANENFSLEHFSYRQLMQIECNYKRYEANQCQQHQGNHKALRL